MVRDADEQQQPETVNEMPTNLTSLHSRINLWIAKHSRRGRLPRRPRSSHDDK